MILQIKNLSVVNALQQNFEIITIMFKCYDIDVWNSITTPCLASVDSIATVLMLASECEVSTDCIYCQGLWLCWFIFKQGKVPLRYGESQVMILGIWVFVKTIF